MADEQRKADAASPVTDSVSTADPGRDRPGREPEHPRQRSLVGIVPPAPNMPDEVGEFDVTLGDPAIVREDPGGSKTPEAEQDAREQERRKLYKDGAEFVSETD